MIKRLFVAAAALAVVAAGPAAARTKSDQNSGSAAAQKQDRKSCRTFQNTASRMKVQRLCLTKEQWKKFDSAS